MVFRELAIPDADDLVFGVAPRPLRTRSGLEIGAGRVYPELNFTLPPMALEESTFPEVRNHYEQIVSSALQRATELRGDVQPGTARKPALAKSAADQLANLDGTLSHQCAPPGPPPMVDIGLRRNDNSTAILSHW